MSTRAIGSALGVSRETVRKDMRESSGGKKLTTSEGNSVTGTDGKTYPRQERLEPSAA